MALIAMPVMPAAAADCHMETATTGAVAAPAHDQHHHDAHSPEQGSATAQPCAHGLCAAGDICVASCALHAQGYIAGAALLPGNDLVAVLHSPPVSVLTGIVLFIDCRPPKLS